MLTFWSWEHWLVHHSSDRMVYLIWFVSVVYTHPQRRVFISWVFPTCWLFIMVYFRRTPVSVFKVSQCRWHPCYVLFCKLWLNLKKAYTQVRRGSTECHRCPFLKVSGSDRKSNNLCKRGDKHNYGLRRFELFRRTDAEVNCTTSVPRCSYLYSKNSAWLRGYVRSSWNLPVHCHAVFSVSVASLKSVRLMNHPKYTLLYMFSVSELKSYRKQDSCDVFSLITSSVCDVGSNQVLLGLHKYKGQWLL